MLFSRVPAPIHMPTQRKGGFLLSYALCEGVFGPKKALAESSNFGENKTEL